MSNATEPQVVDNAPENRHELRAVDERAGRDRGTALSPGVELIHTEIDPASEGRRLGTHEVARMGEGNQLGRLGDPR